MNENPGTSDLRDALRRLWRFKWIFAAIVVAGPVIVYAVSSKTAKTYEASTVLQVEPLGIDSAIAGNANVEFTVQVVATVARLVSTAGVAHEAAARLKPPPRSYRGLLGAVSVVPDTTAGFITITASDHDAARAADIANAFGAAIAKVRARQAVARLDHAIDQLNSQLRSIPSSGQPAGAGGAGEAQPERAELLAQIARLRAVRGAQDGSAPVVEAAVPPTSAVSPRPRRDAALALVVSLLLGVLAVVAADSLDRRIRDPEELEAVTGLPLLAMIPRSAFPGHGPRQQDEEAFQTLRASLTAFNREREISVVMIASPAPGEGKTTVATRLATAFAEEGKSVVLVDADLRRPSVAGRLGLDGFLGLVDHLEHGEPPNKVMHSVAGVGAGRLRVIPAGSTTRAPADLLASSQMAQLLTSLKSVSDIVILDTNPLLLVSDAIPLLRVVSGVVVIGRVGQTTRSSFTRLQRVITSAGGTILGVAATGLSGRGIYGYRGYYYYRQGQGKPPSDPVTPGPVAVGPPVQIADHDPAVRSDAV